MQKTAKILFVFPLMSLMAMAGCGEIDPSLLDNTSTSSSMSSLVGTWSGTLTADNLTDTYQFDIDSAGNMIIAGATFGNAKISNGAVTLTYPSSDNYTITFQGVLNGDEDKIKMSIYSWSGASSGTAMLVGTLTKSGSPANPFLLKDLVGTWTGALVENSLSQNYTFTVDEAGHFTMTNNLSGIATISTSGTVIFTYSSGGFTGTFQGTISADKTKISMSLHTWTGTTSGSASITGTLTKS